MEALIGLAGLIFVAAGLGYSVWLWIKDISGTHKEPEHRPSIQSRPKTKKQAKTPTPAVAATAPPFTPLEISGSTWIALLIVGLLLAAILPLPIGFYTLLRIVVTGGALLLVSILWEQHRTVGNLLIAVAILFNPIFPIWLNKEIWTVLNIGTAIIFLISAWKIHRQTRAN